MRIPFTLKERDYIMSEDFPWYLGIHTSDPKHTTTIQLPNTKEVPMLTHQIYNRGKEHSNLAPSILEQIKEVTNYKKILRVKFNLLLQQEHFISLRYLSLSSSDIIDILCMLSSPFSATISIYFY